MAERQFFRKNSIFVKLLIAMLLLVVMQCIVIIVILFLNHTVEQMDEHSYRMLDSYVSSRAITLEDTMVRTWTNERNFSVLEDNCRRVYTDFQNGLYDDTIIDAKLTESLLVFLRNCSTTGAFIIFDKDVFGQSVYPALYIKDMDPLTSSITNSDILVEFGPASVCKQMQLTFDSLWSPYMQLNRGRSSSNFYFEPFDYAKEHGSKTINEFKYWSHPISIMGDDLQSITFTVPLLSEDGKVFGVIGTEISLDYFYKQLPFTELPSQNAKGGYVLAIDNGNGVLTPLVENGPIFKWLLTESNSIQTEDILQKYNIKGFKVDGQEIVLSSYPLKLYDSNMPYEQEQWVLAGVMYRDDLLEPADRFVASIIITFGLAFIISVVCAFISSFALSKPITRLSKIYRNFPASEQIILPRIKIREIDELSQAIERMSENVRVFNSRLTTIIDISNMPMGAFEYVFEEGVVYCYGKITELMHFPRKYRGMSQIQYNEFILEKENFEKHTKSYGPSRNSGEVTEKIIQYTGSEETQWLKVKVVSGEKSDMSIMMDVSDEIHEKIRVEYERDHDSLTRLLNRSAFKRIVVPILDKLENGDCAMVMWDLDNLKYINDTYGHDYGDFYIKTTADVLNKASEKDVIVARMSGDEFLTFIFGRNRDKILEMIHCLHQKLSDTFFWLPDDKKIPIRISAGISWYRIDGYTYDELVYRADFAMYEAKNTVKGTIKEFDKNVFEDNKLVYSGVEIINNFYESGQVLFAFQPIVDVKNGEIYAFEALMRPQGEYLESVNDVITLSRQYSKLYQLEVLTWTGALKAFSEHKNCFKNAKLFINSVPNMNVSEDLYLSLAEEYRDIAKRIVLEVVENEQAENLNLEIKRSRISSLGGEIALDDFGAGYNTEITLLALKPDYIKLDMALIRNINQDESRRMIVENVVRYAKNSGIKCIAEGIETIAELNTVVRLGVDYVQGYFLGSPEFTLKDIAEDRKKILRDLSNESL